VSPDLSILSDGAEQFNLLAHAGCGVPAERPWLRLIPIGLQILVHSRSAGARLR